MVQTDYALSYHVKNSALDILESICKFNDWKSLDEFIEWFNKIIETRGRVMMVDICNKVHEDSIEAFHKIGFRSPITDNNIFELYKPDGQTMFRLMFPVLNDFTQKEKGGV